MAKLKMERLTNREPPKSAILEAQQNMSVQNKSAFTNAHRLQIGAQRAIS